MKTRLLLSSLVLFCLAFADYARADIARLTVEVDRDALCALCEPDQPQSLDLSEPAPVQFAAYEPAPALSYRLAERMAVPPEKPPACGLGTSPSVCKPRPRWASYALGLMTPSFDAGPAGGLTTSPSVAAAEADPAGFFRQLYQDGKSGAYRGLAAGLLVLLVALARRFGPQLLKGDRGGAALVLIGGIGGALAAALASSAPLSLGLIFDGLMMGFSASGGYVTVRRLLHPKDEA